MLLLCILSGTECACADDEVSLSTIVAAWRAREARVSSLDFSWHGPEFQAGAGNERKDFSFEHRMRLVVDADERLRIEYEGQEWSPAKGAPVRKESIDMHAEGTRRTFFPHGEVEFPNAHIGESDKSVVALDVRTFPLLMNYRPFHQTLGFFDPDKLELTRERGIVDDRACLVLRHSHATAGTDQTVWVDPTRSFVPLRCWITFKGRTTFEIDITYAADEQHGWVPTSWNNTWLDERGGIVNSKSATVDDYKLNQPVPDDIFRVEYPAGTWVHNYLTDEIYILRAGNERRPILAGEYNGTNYKELLRSDPPGHGPSKRLVLLVVSAILLVALVVAVWYRRA
jgi:hypothetical protein